jgi:predicted histone-like DNA-binding protein
MSISYTLVKRKNLSPEAAPDEKLYYAQTQATRTYSFDEICEDATDTSTLSSGDLKLATDRIVLLMVKSLRKGEVVHLGELGNFQLMASSRGAVAEDKFTQSNLRRPHLLFRPGARLRELVATVSCERAVVREKECTQTHL